MKLSDLKAGDKVTIIGGRHSGSRPRRVTTVERVVRNKIVDSGRREWDARNGELWGNKDAWYDGDTIETHRPEHDAEIERLAAVAAARSAVEGIVWEGMTTDDANALRRLVEAMRALNERLKGGA